MPNFVEAEFPTSSLHMEPIVKGTVLTSISNEPKPDPSLEMVDDLKEALDQCFVKSATLDEKNRWNLTFEMLESIFKRVNLKTSELNRFKFWDADKHYTRNLVYTDDKNYTLLLLCWTPGKTSAIHDHPCDACFIKCMSGCIKETIYSCDDNGDLKATKAQFLCEGQVSYMNDDIGYHSVGNPCKDLGAVTLHLYTPPFGSCRCWCSKASEPKFDEAKRCKVGFYSVCGHRTPTMECCPGSLVRTRKDMCDELLAKIPML
jgi:cysteine dioxygenase